MTINEIEIELLRRITKLTEKEIEMDMFKKQRGYRTDLEIEDWLKGRIIKTELKEILNFVTRGEQ